MLRTSSPPLPNGEENGRSARFCFTGAPAHRGHPRRAPRATAVGTTGPRRAARRAHTCATRQPTGWQRGSPSRPAGRPRTRWPAQGGARCPTQSRWSAWQRHGRPQASRSHTTTTRPTRRPPMPTNGTKPKRAGGATAGGSARTQWSPPF
eukprot:756329-Pleurochrysis_carterae.AAC.2